MIAPSRKIIAVAIVCVALVGVTAYVQLAPEKSGAAGVVQNGVLTTIELPEFNLPITVEEDKRDTDNDGLKDWQEVIRGTDSENPDTDGDGTGDAEEAVVDGNISALVIGETEIYSAYVPRSLTDNISKNLFSTYLQAKSEGALSNDDLSSIAGSIANDALSQNQIKTKYTRQAIGTFADSDIEAGEEYGARFGEMYITMLKAIEASPNDLSLIASYYADFAADLSALYVPASLAETQADLGNSFYNIALMFSIVAQYENDPIKAALAIKNLQVILAEQPQLFTAVANYFWRNGIIFESTEVQTLWENI